MKTSCCASKVIIDYIPFQKYDSERPYVQRGTWHACWISCPSSGDDESVAEYKNVFLQKVTERIRIHISADSIYWLYLDGELAGSGPGRGDLSHYSFDSYDLELSEGKHILSATVWYFNKLGPMSRVGLAQGFILGAEGEAAAHLDSNAKNWRCRTVDGISFSSARRTDAWSAVEIDYSRKRTSKRWIASCDGDQGVNAAFAYHYLPQRLLVPESLPPQSGVAIDGFHTVYVGHDISHWYKESDNHPEELAVLQTALATGGRIEFPSGSERQILIDLGNYYCFFPELHFSSARGAVITINYTEGLFLDPIAKGKGNRNDFMGKYFSGHADIIRCADHDGGCFMPPDYRAGRYVELTVKTNEAPLTIFGFTLTESRYPLEMEAAFSCSDEKLNQLIAPAFRTLQMCAHDTYMDCPFYEQLMYVGDTRLQLLLTYVTSRDHRLAEKSILLLAHSQQSNGILQSRYPSRKLQDIPSFSLLFPGIVNDYIKYVDNKAVRQELLPIVRHVIDSFDKWINADGFLQIDRVWNFVDWNECWLRGVPPQGEYGISGVLNWMYVYALSEMAELHLLCEETELAARYNNKAMQMSSRLIKAFYSQEYGLLADVQGENIFSEHTQCMALLSRKLPEEIARTLQNNLFRQDNAIAQCTIYFSHYYFEVCQTYHRYDMFMKRAEKWFGMLNLGLKTLLERPEPSRSDCHAWSSHILYHFFSTLLGVKPVAAGCRKLLISPNIGDLTYLSGSVPLNTGILLIEYWHDNNNLDVKIDLPAGIEATFAFAGKNIPLESGKSSFSIMTPSYNKILEVQTRDQII